MAGIYIHVPFCRKKCHYCDFYRTTATGIKESYLKALMLEMQLRKDEIGNEPVDTIYWGGGTPSVLSPEEIAGILELMKRHFRMEGEQEITLEVNPDDVTLPFLNGLIQAGVNRLSIGIQSFDDRVLHLMNRRHSAETAVRSVEQAFLAGFSDVSIDLIYGIPGLTAEGWENTLLRAMQFPVNHLSAYHLTYHEGTLFHKWLGNGKLIELPEEESVRQFQQLVDLTATAGFEQYEISNFARNNAYSRHNTGYWQGKKYLGLGPSAHSYNGISRSWNVDNLGKYVSSVLSGKPALTREILSEKDKLNDYLITGIRTKWGISLPLIRENFGVGVSDQITREVMIFENRGWVNLSMGTVTLTTAGMFVSDQITRDLMVE